MKVTEPTAVAQIAAQARKERPDAAEGKARQAAAPENGKQAKPAETVAVPPKKQDTYTAQDRSAAPPETQETARFNREITRDYSVDSGQVVVKVIDKEDDEVVREIPPEEQRRIKQAIEELNKNSVVNAKTPDAKDVERASAEAAAQRQESQSSPVEKNGGGVDITT